MKFLTSLVLSLAIASPALAGGLSAPIVESEVIAEEAASSSNAGILVPILALILIGLAISNSGSGGTTEIIETPIVP